jgi:cellulose synthase/poly-beta-1,6-N-acetylglucosamine synthase-like glycosyltransferase
MTSVEIIFWSLIGLCGYIYLVYPAMMLLLSRRFSDSTRVIGTASCSRNEQIPDGSAELPAVSLILYARKQEATILKRLENAVQTDYPSDRFEVIVGCDGDEDLTGDLVRSFKAGAVRSVWFRKRRGKAVLLNECVRVAKGEIIVFAVSDHSLKGNSLRNLTRHFDTPIVGGAYGRLVLTDSVTGFDIVTPLERFDNFLKRNESRTGVFPGEHSALFAIRKERYEPLPLDVLHEGLFLGKHLSRCGFRLQYDEKAYVRKETIPSFDSVFRISVDMIRDEIQSLSHLLCPITLPKGRTAVAFWSRMVLGRFGPGFLISALVLNVSLAWNPMYLQILLLHLLMYLTGAFGMWLSSHEQSELRLQIINGLVTIKARTEIRSQKSEVRSQRSEVRGQKRD